MAARSHLPSVAEPPAAPLMDVCVSGAEPSCSFSAQRPAAHLIGSERLKEARGNKNLVHLSITASKKTKNQKIRQHLGAAVFITLSGLTNPKCRDKCFPPSLRWSFAGRLFPLSENVISSAPTRVRWCFICIENQTIILQPVQQIKMSLLCCCWCWRGCGWREEEGGGRVEGKLRGNMQSLGGGGSLGGVAGAAEHRRVC